MTERVHADPHLPPGRGDHELRDPLEHLGIVDALPIGVQILKAPAAPTARDARR